MTRRRPDLAPSVQAARHEAGSAKLPDLGGLVCEDRRVLGHIGINVPDLVLAKRYYDRLMPLLGFEEFFSASDEFAYMPANGKRGAFIFFYPSAARSPFSRDQTGLQHLAFMVRTRADVDTAHALAVELGSDSVHEPQPWPQYPQPYFAAFWLDPFGIMLEAVCHYDR